MDIAARAGGQDKTLSLVYTVEIAATAPELTLRPVRGTAYVAGVSLTPVDGLR